MESHVNCILSQTLNPIGSSIGVLQPAANTPTLAGAITKLADLNKRLSGLYGSLTDVAVSLGGAFQIGEPTKDTSSSSAMEFLNGGIERAHVYVTGIEGALEAIRRALGANE